MSSIHQQYQSCVYKICINIIPSHPSLTSFLLLVEGGGGGRGWWWCAVLQALQHPTLRPEIEPSPSAVKAWSPNHWTAREFPETSFFYSTLHFKICVGICKPSFSSSTLFSAQYSIVWVYKILFIYPLWNDVFFSLSLFFLNRNPIVYLNL